MYQRVLLPLDGSDTSAQAVPYAQSLALATGAEVALLEVVDVIPPPWRDGQFGRGQAAAESSWAAWRQIQEEAEQYAQQWLEGIARPLEEQGLRVSPLVRSGDAAALIVDEAESAPDTIIVMSTHGRSGIGRWLLGSVTDKVVHAAAQPVLAVRARRDGTASLEALRNIILPLDGSKMAEAAIPHAVGLARAMSLNITVVRAFEMGLDFPLRYAPIYAPPGYIAPEGVGVTEDVRRGQQLAQEYVEGMVETLRAEGLREANGFAVQEEAAQAIRDAAGAGESLVVMASHGRTGLTRWRLGSVADKVIRHGEAPVLVVPIREPQEARTREGKAG